MKKTKKMTNRIKAILIIILCIYVILSVCFYIVFYTVGNRIVFDNENSISILQTTNGCYYEINEKNAMFSPETIYRIENIYTQSNGDKIKYYCYETNFTPLFLINPTYELMSENILDTTIYYEYDENWSSQRLAFYAENDIKLPEISVENIKKIFFESNSMQKDDIYIENATQIEEFLNDYKENFENYDDYTCYFYYKDTDIYEMIDETYLNGYFEIKNDIT